MKTLRIKDSQNEKIRNLSIIVNKRLIQLGKEPLRDSEILHTLIDKALNQVNITDTGEITIIEKK